MSKERAKKKQRQRARAATSARTPAPQRSAEQRASAPTGGSSRTRPTGGRKREDPPTSTPAAAAPRRASRLEVRDGVPRPDAIWAPFPLTEIGMGVGLVLVLIGFAGRLAVLLAGVGILFVTVTELCLREHFAGFRSHSVLLAALPVTAVHAGVVLIGGVQWRGALALALDVAIGAALAWWLWRQFQAAQARARAVTA